MDVCLRAAVCRYTSMSLLFGGWTFLFFCFLVLPRVLWIIFVFFVCLSFFVFFVFFVFELIFC